MEAIQAQIDAQGAKIRGMKEAMKADPASHTKEVLDNEIKELNQLKEKLEAATLDSLDPEVKQRYESVRSVGEECVTESELRNLVLKKPGFVLYDGFEPSGRMHIAQGIFKAMNVNKCTRAGGTFIFWVADWFALMNDKMGGDLDKIKVVGKYLVEVWKATGMDMERVKFVWSSDEITNNAGPYWTQALDIARRTTIARVKKCCQIMGRLENKLTAAQILYPLMQCTDIFFLKADVCQLGVDQRKVNMLAREYCESAGIKNKPVILSHHMLYGLKQGQEKMSKSDPDSAIFMEDSEEDVARKIANAYCPARAEAAPAGDGAGEGEEGEVDAGKESMHLTKDDLKNPCLDYIEHIIFSVPNATFTAAGTTYSSAAAVRADFVGGVLSEAALKEGLVLAINLLLKPVREHFRDDPAAKAILDQVMGWKKETLVPPTGLRRLTLKTPDAPVCLVFAPPAAADAPLGAMLSTLRLVESAPAGHHVVLWCADWSAMAVGACGGELKSIQACQTLLVEALRAVAPDAMAKVQVVVESEAILGGASDYWISVINVGRRMPLHRVREVDEPTDCAGQVVAALMHVGNVLATGAAVILATPSQRASHALALDYFAAAAISDPAPPRLEIIPAVDSCLRALPTPADAAAASAASDAAATGAGAEAPSNADDEVTLLDGSMDVGRKMKRAFCEPQNVAHCPPLVLAEAVCLRPGGSLSIFRKPENGGDKVYTSIDGVREDFTSGALHPGDLKPAVTKGLDAMLQLIRDRCKTVEAAKRADADVRAYLKKASKGKKK